MPIIKLLRDNSKNRQRRPDTAKRQERIKIYQTAQWKRLRAVKLVESPLCERCLSLEGGVKIEPAVDVHHKISFMTTNDPLERERLAFDYDNLQSLCKKCHQKIHNNNYGKDED